MKILNYIKKNFKYWHYLKINERKGEIIKLSE